MKKTILAALAVAGLASGAAFAQATNPAFTGSQPGIAHPELGPADVYGNSGWTPDRAYSSPGQPSYASRGYVYQLPDGRLAVPERHAYRPYASRGRIGDIDGDGIRDARDSDRDGDGVNNRRDRSPDDYRYR